MKYKKVLVSGSFLVDFLSVGVNPKVVVTFGLPAGTKFVYSIPDTINGIWIVVEHDSFDELKDGDLIPDFGKIVMEKLHPYD